MVWCLHILMQINRQHHKKLKDLRLGDLFLEGGDDDNDVNMSINLLTVAGTGNAAFLNELLKAGLDPDVGDSKGKTALVHQFLIPKFLIFLYIYIFFIICINKYLCMYRLVM